MFRKLKYFIACFFIDLFKIKRNKKHIPMGYYCYTYDIERQKNEPPLTGGYWIKPCKYYKYIDENNRACTFLGYFGDDVLLWDQVKICDENKYDDEIDEDNTTVNNSNLNNNNNEN